MNIVVSDNQGNVLGVLSNIKDQKVFHEKLGILIANEILDASIPMATLRGVCHPHGNVATLEDIACAGNKLYNVLFTGIDNNLVKEELCMSATYIY